MKMKNLILVCATACILVACGGNSGGNKTDNYDAQGTGETADKMNNKTASVSSDYLITTTGAGFVVVGDSVMTKIPDNISYELKTITRSEEGYEIEVNTLTLKDITGEIMQVDLTDDERVQEIMVLSSKASTEKGMGPGSKITDFIKAYPDYKIWYTYVAGWIILESPSLKCVQFLLDENDYIGDAKKIKQPVSDMVTLKATDFKTDAIITKVRIFNYY